MISSPEIPPHILPHTSTVSMAMMRIGKFAVSRLPKNWGFALMIFPFDGSSGLRYTSNGTREDVVKLLENFVSHERNQINGKAQG